MSKIQKILIPADMHLHLREGKMMQSIIAYSALQFSDAIIMPNLQPPVTTVKRALEYREELEHAAKGCKFHMALYLTESTTVEEIRKVQAHDETIGYKLYPLNATTGSANGIADIKNVYPLFEEMQKLGVPLMIHGEVTRPDVDIFDREKVFIKEVLTDIVKKFPKLRITLEHITTAEAVQFVMENDNIVASITVHHMLMNRNAIFTVGKDTRLNPHNFCLPVAKTENDRLTLINAAVSGNPKFFAGTDSAPHPITCKESSCGCAGCFTGYHAVELYTMVFAQANRLDKLEDFLSVFGRLHYGIELPTDNQTITIIQEDFIIPDTVGSEKVVPFMHGETIPWKMQRG